MLRVRGSVPPVTLTKRDLCARLVDGSELLGETNIDARETKSWLGIDQVYLNLKAYICAPEVNAIEEAGLVVMGPGDLYTSIIPNLLVNGISDAVRRSGARVAAAVNLMTKPSESDSFKPDVETGL